MLTLRYNPATSRYDCYKGEHIVYTLTCGSRFNLYSDDEGTLVAGKIEHHNNNGYYFIDNEINIMYLTNGLQGILS